MTNNYTVTVIRRRNDETIIKADFKFRQDAEAYLEFLGTSNSLFEVALWDNEREIQIA